MQNTTKSPKKFERRKDQRNGGESSSDEDVSKVEKRMQSVVRAQGRLTKKAGKFMNYGDTSEFQIADTSALG